MHVHWSRGGDSSPALCVTASRCLCRRRHHRGLGKRRPRPSRGGGACFPATLRGAVAVQRGFAPKRESARTGRHSGGRTAGRGRHRRSHGVVWAWPPRRPRQRSRLRWARPHRRRGRKAIPSQRRCTSRPRPRSRPRLRDMVPSSWGLAWSERPTSVAFRLGFATQLRAQQHGSASRVPARVRMISACSSLIDPICLRRGASRLYGGKRCHRVCLSASLFCLLVGWLVGWLSVSPLACIAQDKFSCVAMCLGVDGPVHAGSLSREWP